MPFMRPLRSINNHPGAMRVKSSTMRALEEVERDRSAAFVIYYYSGRGGIVGNAEKRRK